MPKLQLTSAGWLRLRTLTRLRWLAVFGQLVAVVGVFYGLGFDLPLGLCLALVSLSAWLNILLHVRRVEGLRLSARRASGLLAYDICQMAGLLFLTGGLENPFSVLLLVPVIVAASALPLGHIIGLAAITMASASLLVFQHLPLPWYPDQTLQVPFLYVTGIWVSLMAGLGFIAIYVHRIANDARQMNAALAATEQVFARAQRLHALDGLAAAAAHELGTPLATISLVAKEMLRAIDDTDPHAEDIKLLKSQTDRCRDILAKLTSLGDDPDIHFAHIPLGLLLEEVVAPYRQTNCAIDINISSPLDPAANAMPEPVGRRDPSILYGLDNLVGNAVDFAKSRVWITSDWDSEEVTVLISDDGPGIAPDIMGRLGDPYVTTRAHGAQASDEDTETGLGLGFFIAKTLLERSGAKIHLRNRVPPESGAVIRIVWPRSLMDQD